MKVSLSVIEIGKDDAIQNVELNQGQYVKITVSDTGHGIAKKHLDKIFDPYFTTKEVGEGSGIGLSVVMGDHKTTPLFSQDKKREGGFKM
jgi:signal transduction histidine kinase